MLRVFPFLYICAVLIPLWGQEFEVASIRPAAPYKIEDVLDGRVNVGMKVSGTHVSYGSVSVRTLVAYALEVKPYQVQGPASMDSAKFDVATTIPETASAKDAPVMLQKLLAARFGLVFHREMRSYEADVLSVAKGGVRMKQLPVDAPQMLKITGAGGTHYEFQAPIAGLIGPFIAIPQGLPVVDQTGLEGVFAGTVDTSGYRSAGAFEPRAPFRESLGQLGLRLDRQTASLETIVVDRVRTVPSEN